MINLSFYSRLRILECEDCIYFFNKKLPMINCSFYRSSMQFTLAAKIALIVSFTRNFREAFKNVLADFARQGGGGTPPVR